MGLNKDALQPSPTDEKTFPWRRKRDQNVSPMTRSQVTTSLLKSVSFYIRKGSVTREEMEDFMEKRVTGYMVDGVRVLFVEHEYKIAKNGQKPGTLDTPARVLIADGNTYAVGVEYFTPELKRNAKRVPVLGEKLISSQENAGRLFFANQLSDQTAKVNKLLFNADPADRASFVAWFGLSLLADIVGFFPAAPTALSLLTNPNVGGAIELSLKMLPWALYTVYLNYTMGDMERGFYDSNRIHPILQRFFLNPDDSRRLFYAAGIKKFIREAKKKDPEGIKDKQLIIIEPKAHTMTIGDYLEHPHKPKRLIYRLIPGIPHRLRVYKADEETKGINKGDSFDGWRRVQNGRIPLFK